AGGPAGAPSIRTDLAVPRRLRPHVRRSRPPVRVILRVGGLVGTSLVAVALVAGCGGSSGKKSLAGAPKLSSVETPGFCQGYGATGCDPLNTMIDAWLKKAKLDSS